MTTPIKQQLQKGEVYKYQSINQHPEQQQSRSDDQKGEKKMDQNNNNFGQTTNRYPRLCAVLRCGIVTLDHDRLLSMGKNRFPRIQVIVLN